MPVQEVPPTELAAIWQATREKLRRSVPESTFRLWLEPLRPVASRAGVLHLTAPDGIRAWVDRRYSSLITGAMTQVTDQLASVSFAQPGAQEERSKRSRLELNPSYTFERFVIGDENRLAHAAALAVAEAPAEAYNPLFLHGPPGLGKTHLLCAIGNYLRVHAPELTVRYATAESFTNEFVNALRESGGEAFKRRYRDIDVLLIDDVQFLERKRATEEEFFHTFNALHEAGSQLVFSADRIPSQLSDLEARLRDRFEWGLTVALERPNLATRLAVLRKLVAEAGVEATDGDALNILADRIDVNLRQLRGALTRVLAHASLMARPLTSDLVSEVLGSRNEPSLLLTPGIEAIKKQVAGAYGLTPGDLESRARTAGPTKARNIAFYLARELTDDSLPSIGRHFGGRHHSTVLTAIRHFELEMESDPATRQAVEQLRSAIHNPPPSQR